MNSEQAKALVIGLFPRAFDRGRFLGFAKNLLNRIDDSKIRSWSETEIKDAFKDHIKHFERLGIYTTQDRERVEVLVVHLTAATKLARARTALRNFVADHLKTQDNKDAAIVAFVSPTEKQWRLSYVRMEYTAGTEGGRVTVETRLTPARRRSYIVGDGESCHTAQSRFLDLLQDTENRPSLAQLEDAFSVEAVTKEFFEQYKELFLTLTETIDALVVKDRVIAAEFRAKRVDIGDFAKKLMGQIVFLYFLQKKGWLGVPKGHDWGDGPRDFLRQLFAGRFGGYKNFFNDILEPLFYDTLAADRGHDAWCVAFKSRIPFLNGGLFEPLYDWQKTDIVIPNALFANSTLTAMGDEGTGILDVFDRYNFTVNEAEPLEQEVAIDPEMLGKVFENLLGVKERKSKGSFYTPREIVHHMCQESLINYLDTAVNSEQQTIPRQEIETLVHSGDQAASYEAARREGASYQRTLPKNIEKHARVLDKALADIAVCDPAIGSGAFPVGMMQEIVRARTTLTPYFNDVRERNAYQFKRHAIQACLYGVDVDPGAVEIAKLRLWLSLVVDEDDVIHIKPLPNLDYKVLTGNSLIGVEKNLFNAHLFGRLEELKPSYFDATNRDEKDRLRSEIDGLIHELTNGKEAFDFEVYFSEVFHKNKGFHVVIGNPPWGADLTAAEGRDLSARYPDVPSKTKDSYFYFVCKAIDILRPSGTLSLIVPNTWMLINAAKSFRRWLLSFDLKQIIEHGDGIFEQATVESATVILVKDKIAQGACRAIRFRKGLVVVDHQVEKDIWLRDDLARINVNIDSTEAELLAKLRAANESFEKDCTITWGIKPYQVGYGTPPQTREMVDERVYHAATKRGHGWKPLLVGKNVNRYSLIFPGDLFIKYGKWLMYPSNERVMLGPKLLMRQTSDIIRCCYDDRGYYCQNSVFLVHSLALDLKYLLALLNSSLLGFVYKCGNPQVGKVFAEVKPSVIKSLPIRRVKNSDRSGLAMHQAIVERVDRIMAAKQHDALADTTALEREIDELVFSLYELTADEKMLVQSAAS